MKWLLVVVFFLLSIGATLAKSFPKKPGIWMYEGSLIDPVNGQRIANVVGIEQFQPLVKNENVEQHYPAALSQWKNIPHECYRSRKIFCYTDVSSPGDSLLQFYRRRTRGPKRKIPLSQSVICSESTVSYLDNGRFLYTELDNGRSAFGTIEPSSSISHDDGVDEGKFKVYSVPKRIVREEEVLQIVNELSPNHHNHQSVAGTPRRHSIIQFGGMGTTGQQPQRGVRETYDYRDGWTVSYTRYGEGPVWYGLGRMAQLELTGKHYDDNSNNDTVPNVSTMTIPSVLADLIPKDFWNTQKVYMNHDNSTVRSSFHDMKQQRTRRTWLTKLRSATSFSVGGRRDNHY